VTPPAAAGLGLPEVRVAGLADVGRLVELYEAALVELGTMRGGRVLLGLDGRDRPLATSFSRQVAGPAERLVVGTLGGEVIGYGSCVVKPLPGPDLLGVVQELYVSSVARRAGVGRAMAASLMSWCRSQGCTGIDASALPGNRAVKSFFEGNGFTARLLVMYRPLS
jgi:ribosomal protein S18 acetylase RimI-like enzyme